MRVKIDKQVRNKLALYGWDVDEIEQTLPLTYFDKKDICVTDCDDDVFHCIMDGKLHILNCEGEEQPVITER